jgi:hypothetical protein
MIELYRLGRESPPSGACGVMEHYFICYYVELLFVS